MPGYPASGARARGVPRAPSWPALAARPWPTRDGLDPLIQLRCLTNPRLAAHRRNAGWIKRLQGRPRCYPCYLLK